jgi:CBS domain-containing protein
MSPASLPANKSLTYIVGHRNPDADAICSAIAYAAFKEARGQSGFVAARCGNSNARIDAILGRFNQPLPLYLSDVTPRVRDVMVQDVISVQESATCAEALELIESRDIRVLPVVSGDRRLVGTVSNRDAIGARLEVLDGDSPPPAIQVTGGGSYLSHSDRRLHVVLPAAPPADAARLRVRWPSGIVQDVEVSGADREVCIVEAGELPPPASPSGGAS